MKMLMMLVLLSLVSACAGMPTKRVTIHDYCIVHALSYATYNECFTEMKALQAHRRAEQLRTIQRNDAIVDDLVRSVQTGYAIATQPVYTPPLRQCHWINNAYGYKEQICN